MIMMVMMQNMEVVEDENGENEVVEYLVVLVGGIKNRK